MTDRHPVDPALEDRLRSTLVAEAERHPVRADVEALRIWADRTLIDLRLPPRRNRARIVAAAVVLAVLAAGAGVAIGHTGDPGEPVTSGPALPSGYYLPGPGWEVVAIEAVSTTDRAPLREAVYWSGSRAPDGPRLTVDVVRGTASDEVRAAWEGAGAEPVALEPDGSSRRAWVVETAGSNDGTAVEDRRVLVPGDDEVLVLMATDVDLATLLDVAEGWLSSDGRLVRVPSETLQRAFDQSYTDAEPLGAADLGGLAAQGLPFDGSPASTIEVMIQVRSASGAVASLSITPPGAQGRPTGVGDRDRGEARGVEHGPAPTFNHRTDGEVWFVMDGDEQSLWALLPGADISIRNDLTTSGVPSTDYDAMQDLVDGLRMVDRAEWVDAVGQRGSGPIDGVAWGDVLATTDPLPAEAASETTVAEAPVDPGEVPETTTEGTDPSAADDRTPPEGQALAVLDALHGVAVSGPEDAFADRVTLGLVGDPSTDVVRDVNMLGDGVVWSLDLGGRWGREGSASALDLLASSEVTVRHPGPARPACVGDEVAAEDDLFVYEPTDAESCLDWFAVVVRLDADGRIAEVRLRLWEP